MSRAKRRPHGAARHGETSTPDEQGEGSHPHREREAAGFRRIVPPDDVGPVTTHRSPAGEHTGAVPPPGPTRRSGPRTMRVRISEGDPWSVMVTSFLLLAGLGVVAIVTTVVLWVMLEVLAPNALPDLTTVLAIAVGVVILEVVLGAGLATLSTFVYNLSAQYHGGLEVAVTDDLSDPTPAAAEALLLMARSRARARTYLRRHSPSWAREAVRRLPEGGPRTGGTPPARPQPVADGPAPAADGLDAAPKGSDTV
ncbi:MULTISPECIES: DUF3566 domain-containing protein [unclassified Streptomyces]|uniref:DUF3566 domain-containing protein n=1 Tax=unclassified Streptomyces TaxID=2593676 RepID=UPI0009A136A6|nr:DUF3566 domain-containing protein [Streptomyces sp. CB01883]